MWLLTINNELINLDHVKTISAYTEKDKDFIIFNLVAMFKDDSDEILYILYSEKYSNRKDGCYVIDGLIDYIRGEMSCAKTNNYVINMPLLLGKVLECKRIDDAKKEIRDE